MLAGDAGMIQHHVIGGQPPKHGCPLHYRDRSAAASIRHSAQRQMKRHRFIVGKHALSSWLHGLCL
jgi:hypothetical protein